MEKSDGNTEMSVAFADDNVLARELIETIGGDAWSGKGAALERAYQALAKAFPRSNWTRRRVKGLYQGEAASVAFREMRELAETALAEQALHEKRRKAREDHAQFIAETARLASVALRRREERSGAAHP